jgi:hypothetical protein
MTLVGSIHNSVRENGVSAARLMPGADVTVYCGALEGASAIAF